MKINVKNKSHRFFVDFILLIVPTYFIVKKTTKFSGSEFIKSIFQPKISEIIIDSLLVIVLYSLIAKLVLYTLDYFHKVEPPSLCFPHYRCLLNNNKEIEKHIKGLKAGTFTLKNIDKNHSYEENTQIIHRNFSEHLFASLKDSEMGASDIFLSLFHEENFRFDFENIEKFHYSSHYDPTIHETSTSVIEVNKKKFSSFAGIRAIKKKTVVICHTIDKTSYDIGEEERRKSIKHYIGIPLRINGFVVGLLNIEFHNKIIFSSTEEMKAFYQKEIQAFIYLYEYQMHKKYLFQHLNDKMVIT
ncbi:MAG: GAF domain-containing protein [Methylococcaceae bacterium]|nr:GAF domain-containing protein [Methylococcaceae bacterium]